MKVASYNIINNIEQDELDAGRLQEVYEIDIEIGKKVTLPDSFNSEIRAAVSYTHLTLPTTSAV